MNMTKILAAPRSDRLPDLEDRATPLTTPLTTPRKLCRSYELCELT